MNDDESTDWLLDQVIGNYRIIASIGQGGMGSVYFATHEVLERHAAVKVLLPEFTGNAELVTRFFREARATSQLRHRAFVEIFDSGRLGDGSAYLVMDYLRGESLAGYLRRIGPLAVDDALAIAHDLAEGVGFANGHGIVHRDLKPDNVFLTVEQGEAGRPGGVVVKVLDFGIAKLMGESEGKGKGKGTAQTRAGALLGTPLYMAPEQCRGAGQAQIDQRADLYAFGCIVHEMLTGAPPFPLEGFGEIIAAQLATPPPPVRTLRAEVPPSVEALVLLLLAKQPSARPPDMATVARAIEGLRAELTTRGGATAVGAGSVARLPVLLPPLPVATIPPRPRPSSAPMRAPFPPGSGPGLARTTPAVDLLEPARGSSPGGTKLLPTPAEGVGAGPRSGRSGSGRGSGARHPPSISTLGAGTGEVRGGRTERRGGRGKMLVVAALVAGGGIAAAAFKLTSTPSPPLVSAPAPPGPAARPVEPPPAPAVAADPPKRAKPQTVSVRINSEPSDASLIDARTGDTLGRTPFLRDLPRADATMMVTVRKGGYRSKQISLDLDRDTALEVKLEHKPASSSSSKPSEDDVYRKL